MLLSMQLLANKVKQKWVKRFDNVSFRGRMAEKNNI